MNFIFRFQDVLEIMNNGFLSLQENATEARRTTHREMSKKYGKGLFLINQCVDSNVFEKIIEKEITKCVWDTLKMLYGENEKLKKTKLQSLRKKYENSQMNDGEGDAQFFWWF